jgi:putative glutamine amidotransferase
MSEPQLDNRSRAQPPAPAALRHRPVVLVPSCNRMLGLHPFHVVGKKYVDAARLAGGLPLVVPMAQRDEIDALLDSADGVLLTGSPSNVHPSNYGEEVYDQTLPLDPVRDDWTLPLIPRALERGIPLFAICRGFQETNVALGGSLHQAVQNVPGKRDHRADYDGTPLDVQYAPSHSVRVLPGGLLERIAGAGEFDVNSLHGQGIKDLARGLRVEAVAPDGLVEAFTVAGAPGFSLCVQWHPEWQAQSNPLSMRLLKAFGAACQAYRDTHRPPSSPRQ